MDDKDRHFNLFSKEKLVDLLVERANNFEGMEERLGNQTRQSANLLAQVVEYAAANKAYRKQINLMAERLGKRGAQSNFANSLVMEGSDSLREIAEKVTEGAEAEHEEKMVGMAHWASLRHHEKACAAQRESVAYQADVAKSQHKACVDQARAHADKWKYSYDSATAKANFTRDGFVSLYTNQTAQTMIRWIIGSAAFVSSVYLYLSF